MKKDVPVSAAAVEQQVFTRPEAAVYLRVRPALLAAMGSQMRGPRFTKFGPAPRCPVRYRLEDLVDWLADPVRHEQKVWRSRRTKQARKK